MAMKFTRIATKYAAIKPRMIADQASPTHICSVITDMQKAILEMETMLIAAYMGLTTAESFMSGFEDDETQINMNTKLGLVRGAIKKMQAES